MAKVSPKIDSSSSSFLLPWQYYLDIASEIEIWHAGSIHENNFIKGILDDLDGLVLVWFGWFGFSSTIQLPHPFQVVS